MRINLIGCNSLIRTIFLFKEQIVKINSRSMSNAYLRHEEDCDRFQFSFNFEFKHGKRQFNFSRQRSETLLDFMSRISNNVGKAVDKKNKRSKAKKDASNPELGNPELGNPSEIKVQFTKDGVPLPSELKCGDVLFQGGLKLLVYDQTYEVEVNSPWVNAIVLPDSILADFPVYPCKLDLDNADRDASYFLWFKSEDSKRNDFNWTKVGEGFFYTPSSGDIGSRLKITCIPKVRQDAEGNILREGPAVEAISPTNVEAGPGICPFETRHGFTSEHVSNESVRLVSYNILADTYVDSDFSRTVLYPYCPPYALAINYRKQLLLKELIGYKADLMCLQEVDAKVYEFDLTPVLNSVGYSGVYQRKGDGRVSEGLACFFSKTKFKLINSSSVLLGKELSTNPVFSELYNHLLESFPEPSKFLEQMSELPTTVQAIVIEVIEEGRMKGQRIVLGTTHLYFHPLADNIRLFQTGMALRYLEHIVEEASRESCKRASLLFCGDFNSTPEFGVLRLVTSGFVAADDPDWSSGKGIETEESEQVLRQFQEASSDELSRNRTDFKPGECVGIEMSHPFALASAYGNLDFTNYTSGFVGCLDYIFYSTDFFKVEQVVPLPSEEEVSQNIALPSVVFPSDHLALVADLRWNI